MDDVKVVHMLGRWVARTFRFEVIEPMDFALAASTIHRTIGDSALSLVIHVKVDLLRNGAVEVPLYEDFPDHLVSDIRAAFKAAGLPEKYPDMNF